MSLSRTVVSALAFGAVMLPVQESRAYVLCKSDMPLPVTLQLGSELSIYMNGDPANQVSTPLGTESYTYVFRAHTANSAEAFSLYWLSNGDPFVANGMEYMVLGEGATVGPSSNWADLFSVPGAYNAWRQGQNGKYLGARYSLDGMTRYGFIQMDTTGPTGMPVTFNRYCFEQDGSPIVTGAAVTGVTVPGAPRIVSVVPGDSMVTITIEPPASNGGLPIDIYYIESTPYAYLNCQFPSPCEFEGLMNGTSYTFVAYANNDVGGGPGSAPSAPVVVGAVDAGAAGSVDSGATGGVDAGGSSDVDAGAAEDVDAGTQGNEDAGDSSSAGGGSCTCASTPDAAHRMAPLAALALLVVRLRRRVFRGR